jgi:hypothetical protein
MFAIFPPGIDRGQAVMRHGPDLAAKSGTNVFIENL